MLPFECAWNVQEVWRSRLFVVAEKEINGKRNR